MKYLISNVEILKKFEIRNSNVQNVLDFGHLAFEYCLEFRNSKFGFTPERSF